MVEKSDEIRIEHVKNFDEQNFDELIIAFIRKVLTGKGLEGKILMNRSPFVKFVKLFHRQSFTLYSSSVCSLHITRIHYSGHLFICMFSFVHSDHDNGSLWKIIVSSALAVVGLALIMILIYMCRRKYRSRSKGSL